MATGGCPSLPCGEATVFFEAARFLDPAPPSEGFGAVLLPFRAGFAAGFFDAVRAFLPVQSGNRERTRDRPRSAAVFAAFDDPRFVEAVLDLAGDLAVARDRFLGEGELGRRALAPTAGCLAGADLERAAEVLSGAREQH